MLLYIYNTLSDCCDILLAVILKSTIIFTTPQVYEINYMLELSIFTQSLLHRKMKNIKLVHQN